MVVLWLSYDWEFFLYPLGVQIRWLTFFWKWTLEVVYLGQLCLLSEKVGCLFSHGWNEDQENGGWSLEGKWHRAREGGLSKFLCNYSEVWGASIKESCFEMCRNRDNFYKMLCESFVTCQSVPFSYRKSKNVCEIPSAYQTLFLTWGKQAWTKGSGSVLLLRGSKWHHVNE